MLAELPVKSGLRSYGGLLTSRNQKLVKIIRHENNECQLYMQKYDQGMGFIRLEFDGTKPRYVLEWKYLTALLSCTVIKKIYSIEVKYDNDSS